MLNNLAMSTPGGNPSREDSPWRRLPYTGPAAVIGWLLALSALPYFTQHVTTALPHAPEIEARIIELSPPPKPVPMPAPPVVTAPPQHKPQPVRHPQSHAEPVAPPPPVVEQPPAPVAQGNPQPAPAPIAPQGTADAAPVPNDGARAIASHGINVRAGSIGVVEPQPQYHTAATTIGRKDASIYNEEAFSTVPGFPPATGLWHQEYSGVCDPADPTDQSCGMSYFSQPPSPWCYNANPFYPWETGTCSQDFDKAVTAYKRKDYATAFALLKKLADNEYAPAESDLAAMYADGTGAAKDEQLAVSWWRKAAKESDPKAVYNLALMYSDGRGVKKDDKEAAHWFRKAAYFGYEFAQYNLAVMYATGTGVEKDDKQAAFWYRKSAKRGNPDAEYNLGAMYARGAGVPRDEKKAVYWYCKATVRSSKEAQENLRSIYAIGTVKPSYSELDYFCWLVGLPKRDFIYAVQDRLAMEQPLTPEQRARAQAAARKWQP